MVHTDKPSLGFGWRYLDSNPVAPLERLVNETLTVGDILSTPLWFAPPTMSVADVAGRMETHQFDVGGVGPEPLARFIELAQLTELVGRNPDLPVGDFAQPIPASICIERSLPISELFVLLRDQPHLFVLNGDKVRWVVTRADLSAPAIGAAVLGFFTIFEAGLKELSRDLSDERLKEILNSSSKKRAGRPDSPSPSLERALNLYTTLQKKNAHTEFRDCLTLADWLGVVAKEPALLKILGFKSRSAMERAWNRFVEVRNDVAHVRGLLHTSSVEDAIRKITAIQTAGRLVWSAVRDQAQAAERFANYIVTATEPSPMTLTGQTAVADYPFTGSVYVLSASNPGGVGRSATENELANMRLAESFRRQGKVPLKATLESPDGTVRREGLLVEHLTDQTASEVAASFGQLSLFKITADEFSVLDARSSHTVATVARVATATGN